MKALVAAALVLLPALASAQVNIDIGVQLPQIHFEAPPPLVVVTPGVQVVENYNEDLYVADGYYWVRRDGRWYRARDHRGGWVLVEERVVPVEVARIPPGHYKKWKGGKGEVVPASAKEHGHGKGHGHGKK